MEEDGRSGEVDSMVNIHRVLERNQREIRIFLPYFARGLERISEGEGNCCIKFAIFETFFSQSQL